jgi:non-lysosomal glucosylceramidase
MLWEGLTLEGLAITRMLHDRHHASRRNPWNEVECGDHYARSMASYGVYLAACGFSYHGPRGHLGFAPRLTPDDFKCAFTAAEGWGTFSQKRDPRGSRCDLRLRWGRLKLNSISLVLADTAVAEKVQVKCNGRELQAHYRENQTELVVTLSATTQLAAGDRIEISVQAGV